MSEEAKTGTEAVAVAAVNPSVPKGHPHADTLAKVSKFDQSKDAIPKVVPPRGSKDARSFRPSTLAEINMMNRYEPLTMQACGRTIPIGCGNSLEDVLLICGCIFALWSFVLGLAALLLKSAIDTDRYTQTHYVRLHFQHYSSSSSSSSGSSSGSSGISSGSGSGGSSSQHRACKQFLCTLTFRASSVFFQSWTR